MALERRIRGIFSIMVHIIVAVSMIWTFLSAITLIRSRINASARKANSVSAHPKENISLPRFDLDAANSALLEKLMLIADKESKMHEDESMHGRVLINSSINLVAADSTYFYRLVYLSECSCPAETTDRYDIHIKYIDPRSFEILREDHYRKLSAEDANRFNGLISIERR
jgi:hypothetical protein